MRIALKTLAMWLLLAFAARAAEPSFTAVLDHDDLMVGETAMLSLRFQNCSPQGVPQLPAVDGLDIGTPSQQQISQTVNFDTSMLLVYSFPITPQRPGEFTVPSMSIKAGDKLYSTEPIKFTARQPSPPSAEALNSGREPAFFKLNLPKAKVYAGETLIARLELFLRNDVQRLNGFQITSLPAEGFSTGKPTELAGQQRDVRIGNSVYRMVPLALPLTAVKTGQTVVGPVTANVGLVLPGRDQGGDPFFRQFFNQGEQRQMTIATEAVNVESLPLPLENRPANFSGAIGDFTMTSTAGPTEVTVGDPITVRVTIAGRGALDTINLPKQDSWENFKLFPPTSKVEASDQFGFQGKKMFEEIISPLNSNVREVPALSFSFFNPNDGQYHTLTEPPVALNVKSAGATPLPTVASKNPAEEKSSPDILPVKNDLGPLVKNSAPLISSPGFLATQSIPVLAFLAALVWRKRAENLANNPRLRRQRAVAALVAGGLMDLKKSAAANQPDEFFATLFRLLQEQLGERLDCPATSITENVVEENPVLKNAPTALRESLREQFQLCNQARYAPVRGTSELNSVAAQFEKLLGELQNLKS